MSQLNKSIEISLRENGTYLCEFKADGITVDRYNTDDLRKLVKNERAWMKRIRDIASQPSANIAIAIPPIPALQPTREERLQRELDELKDHALMAEYNRHEFKCFDELTPIRDPEAFYKNLENLAGIERGCEELEGPGC